jgi:DNA-binding MarR family transcriptional regulator
MDSNHDKDPVVLARRFWDAEGLGAGDTYEFVSSIYRVNQDILEQIASVLKPFGLNVTNYFALFAISMRGEHGLATGQLARSIKVHQTTITMVLDQLEKVALVERRPHPRDRRVTLAMLTPGGSALTHKASEALAEINFGLPTLPQASHRHVIRVLRKVRVETGDIS